MISFSYTVRQSINGTYQGPTGCHTSELQGYRDLCLGCQDPYVGSRIKWGKGFLVAGTVWTKVYQTKRLETELCRVAGGRARTGKALGFPAFSGNSH